MFLLQRIDRVETRNHCRQPFRITINTLILRGNFAFQILHIEMRTGKSLRKSGRSGMNLAHPVDCGAQRSQPRHHSRLIGA